MRTLVVVVFLVVMSVLISILALGPGRIASVEAAPLSCVPMEEKLVCEDGTVGPTLSCDELAVDVVLCHRA